MELRKKYKLSKIVSKDDLRPAINQIYINLETRKAVATNTQILAEVPIDIADDQKGSGLISTQAFDHIVGKKDVSVKENIISFEDDHDKYEFEIHNDEAFPGYESLFPEEPPMVKIALDATLLNKLAQAMGTKSVILSISGPAKTIVVEPLADQEDGLPTPRGILMPIQTQKVES